MYAYKVIREQECNVYELERCEGCRVYFVPEEDETMCAACLSKEDPWPPSNELDEGEIIT
jgi:hypothetical protein